MKRDLGWFEWYIEVQIYMSLEVKAKWEEATLCVSLIINNVVPRFCCYSISSELFGLFIVLFKIMWLNVIICSNYWVVENSSLSAVLQRWILETNFYFSIVRIKQLNDTIGKISTTIGDTQTSELQDWGGSW